MNVLRPSGQQSQGGACWIHTLHPVLKLNPAKLKHFMEKIRFAKLAENINYIIMEDNFFSFEAVGEITEENSDS